MSFRSFYKVNKCFLRNILQTIYFNFRILPFKQAVYLPIALYKPTFKHLSGKVILTQEKIKPLMYKWGYNRVGIYPNNGIIINIEGTIEIRGDVNNIGNNSAVSVGSNAHLSFLGNFDATAGLKIVCFNKIIYNPNVLVGWDCLFMDTDFHKLRRENGTYTKGYGAIEIGENNWFTCKCTILKGTKTPNHCTVAAQSVLNREYNFKENCIIGTRKQVEVLADDISLDFSNNSVCYLSE